MSQKQAKKARKDYMERRDAFMKEVQSLSAKYYIDMIAVIEWGNLGARPEIALVDIKDKYENITPEAAAENEKERGKVDTTDGEVSSPDESTTPKIEV